MRIRSLNKRVIISLAVLATVVTVVSLDALAGGPSIINARTGDAVKWARFQVQGGPLNTQTVDSQGRVLYRVDSGPLGNLTSEEATALVDRIFRQYTDIPTATIEYVNAGRILNPATGEPVDVTGTNIGAFISETNPAFQNPIVFDTNGQVVTALGGDSLTLGLAGALSFTTDESAVTEAIVVLNGSALTRGLLSKTSFQGVFTHEFAHFAGPLDHSQINGSIADPGTGSISPPAGFTAGQAYDLYTPFMETMYPFIFDPPAGSQIASQFGDTGFFIASLDMDTQNALSNLYPTSDYAAITGAISGRVVIKTAGGDIPVTGINVIARRIDQGGYVPPLGTPAFLSSPIPTDGNGVPPLPPVQGATDSLATVSSAVTGLAFNPGEYRIQGLPSGQYLVQFQQIDSDFVGGSGIGPLFDQLVLPFSEQYFNGQNSSSNSANIFTPVPVSVGQVTNGIDLILNGFSNAAPVLTNEVEPNEVKKKPQKLSGLPVDIRGAAASTDASVLKIDFGGGVSDRIEDLYRFTVTTQGFYAFSLEAISGSGDLDLWIFDNGVNKKKTSVQDPFLISFSATESSSEFVLVRLTPGTYLIGVSSFSGSQGYRLRAIPSA
jgi:hypothetical protein